MAIIETPQNEKAVELKLPNAAHAPTLKEWIAIGTRLFKLRIVMLLMFASFGGAALGVLGGGELTLARAILLTVAGALSAAGASAINQFLEIERDAQMRRTASRPFVLGQIKRPQNVLYVAIAMIAVAAGLALWARLPLFAFWLVAGALIYVGVYTVWLKPRSSLNIVIGGAAGSCAIIAGGAAVGTPWDPSVWVLSAMLFFWTPVHFWALALAYREDYKRAAYPMLPALISEQSTAKWISLHTVLTVGLTLLLAVFPVVDGVLLILMGLISLPLLYQNVRLLIQPDRKTAFKLFHASNLFLAAVLTAVMLSLVWRI